MLWSLRARLGYLLARRLLGWPWLVKQPRAWQWMQGQFSRMAALGDVAAQSFYGHLLLFRGQGLGAREEGMRLLRLAAQAGDGKAAYQLGVLSLAGDTRQAADGQLAASWWAMAAAAGHPWRRGGWRPCTVMARRGSKPTRSWHNATRRVRPSWGSDCSPAAYRRCAGCNPAHPWRDAWPVRPAPPTGWHPAGRRLVDAGARRRWTGSTGQTPDAGPGG